MKVYPQRYGREDFIKYLQKINASETTINKFNELPEIIERTGSTYKLYINVTWYNVGNTHYSFELNYYCEELIEYMFNSKVFPDVEHSINNLLCELMGANCIQKTKKKK